MKFGKEFTAQMVPEWQQAYMDYNMLKSLLKNIKKHRQGSTNPQPKPGLHRKMTLYRAFSGLTHHKHAPPHAPIISSEQDVENQVILVTRNGEEEYRTTFLKAGEDGGEYDVAFFQKLDDEFHKVSEFYHGKVDQVLEEAEMLNKQMNAFIGFRVKVEHPNGLLAQSEKDVEMRVLASDISASSAALSASSPRVRSKRAVHMVVMDAIEEGSSKGGSLSKPEKEGEITEISNPDDGEGKKKKIVMEEGEMTEISNPDDGEGKKKKKIVMEEGELTEISNPDDGEGNKKKKTVMEEGELTEISNPDDGGGKKKKKKVVIATPVPPLEVLQNVKMNNSLETPRSTIKGFLNYSNHTQLNFNKENFKTIEEKLKKAFLVFHQKLDLLKRFSFLNILAFSKIMRKYDKITSRNASKSYMKMVDASHLGSSEEVTKMMERAEQTFIKHFCNSNQRKAMKMLRPKAKIERHRTSFTMGFFAGCMVSLVVALALIIRARKILDSEGSTTYMETLFPLYSLFGFVVLHMLMYAGNIYFWRRYRVNYSFIFGFKQGTEMNYRDMLFLSFGLAVLALGCVLANLDMEMDSLTKDYKAFTELLPLFLLLLLIVILFFPFNILYRSSRFFLIGCLLHCLAAPLYKVTLPDFFLADQLTSQVQAFRSMEFYICYYGWGDYRHRENTCHSNVYNTFYFLVAVIPYWSRLLQCLRRLFEEKDPVQGWNGLKYFLTIVALCLRTAYSLSKGPNWNKIAWVFSIIAAIFGTYWDLVFDWGLLQMKSKNFLLRDKLLVPYKSVYFAAMASNVLLRLAWMQTVLDFQVSFLHGQALIAVVACLEIIRRGIWNFFRLENEHLNNVGKYRAFKSVPLPFNYEDEEEKED